MQRSCFRLFPGGSSENPWSIYPGTAGSMLPRPLQGGRCFRMFQGAPQGTSDRAALCLCLPVFSSRASGDATVIYSSSAAAAAATATEVRVGHDGWMNERLSHLLAHMQRVYFRLQAEQTRLLFLFTALMAECSFTST